MAYHTLTDLTNALTEVTVIQLTDDDDAGVVDTAKTDAAAASAQGVIDTYLRARYTLPLATVPDVLKTISLALTIAELWRRRASEEMPASVLAERKWALGLLEQIRTGDVPLLETDKSGSYQCNKRAEDRLWPSSTLDTM